MRAAGFQMQPDEFTSFWSAVVSPGVPCTVTVPDGAECALTNACLAQDGMWPGSGNSVLFVRVNGSPEVAVAPFMIGKFESTCLDLRFQEGDSITFRVFGAGVPIHICGMYTGLSTLEIS